MNMSAGACAGGDVGTDATLILIITYYILHITYYMQATF